MGGFEFIGRHAGTNRTRLKIDHTTGDISFYEDTGTTAKLFWDASAEALGIGTTSPSFSGFGTSTSGIDIVNSSNAALRLSGNAADAMFFVSGSSRHWLYGKGAVPMTFSTNSLERMRIASDGSLSTPTLGTSNVRFGVNAGNSITSGGNYNVVVGDEAGTAIDYWVIENVAIGYSALATEDTATHNTAVGTFALATQNAGDVASYNTGIGHSAGYAVTTGTNNTFIGGLSGDANTTASNNTAVGYNSLGANTTGTRMTSVGSRSGMQNTTGNYNAFFGYDSGESNTTGVFKRFLW